jgi:hypothetical protein
MDGLSSFACPHGSTCDQFADVCDAPAGGSTQAAQPTATQAVSSAAVGSSQVAESTVQMTSVQVVTSAVEPESTVQSVQPSTVTVVSTTSSQGVNAATTSKSVASSLGSFPPALALAAMAVMFGWL